jgi:hypothetical protein
MTERANHDNKYNKQRALVLQGGGALGAYEVGVIKGLCNKLMEKDMKKGTNNQPLFDIVAGTSIGAMNAAVLVSNIVKKDKTWSEAVEELERFWKEGIALKEGITSDDDIVPVGIFRFFPWWKPWTGQARSYDDLLRGRFRLNKVVRIDRRDDGNEVFDMLFDYSSTSIENLMRDGCRDAHIQSLREGLKAIKSKTGNQDGKSLEKVESYIQEIEKGINVENSYDRQIEDFTRAVQSLPDKVGYNGSIGEEKAVLVHAAKQFKEIITEAHSGCVHARV